MHIKSRNASPKHKCLSPSFTNFNFLLPFDAHSVTIVHHSLFVHVSAILTHICYTFHAQSEDVY